MKLELQSVLLLLVLTLSGCLVIPPEEQKAHLAPLLSTTEISTGASMFYLKMKRWPETKAELTVGLALSGTPAQFFDQVTSMVLEEHSPTSALYLFHFASGGTNRLRINLNVSAEPVNDSTDTKPATPAPKPETIPLPNG